MSDFQKPGFIVEAEASGASQYNEGGGDFPWLALPSNGPSRLMSSSNVGPRLVSLAGADQKPTSDQSAEFAPITFAKVQNGFQSYVAMMTPPNAEVRVNGMPVGPVAILQTKDQLQLADDYVLHVSVRHQPHIGPADESEVGGECLLCRTPIIDGQTLFRCTNCGAALHCGGPDRPEHDRLECALASSDCPRCRRPFVREEGFEYVPEL